MAISRSKKDGSKVSVYFNPSNLQIKELHLEDRQRVKALNRKATPISDKKSIPGDVKKTEERKEDKKAEAKSKETKK